MGNRLLVVAFGAFVAVVAAGCSSPPTADIDSANAALAAAESAEAPAYAADTFKAAQDAQAQLQAELTVQEEKFALFRSYTRATELAATAKQASELAQTTAATEKEKVRVETVQLIADAKTAVEEAKKLLETAPRGKGSAADIAVMKADLAAVELALGEADAAVTAGNFIEARTKAQTAMQATGQVKTSVEEAQARRGGARPRA